MNENDAHEPELDESVELHAAPVDADSVELLRRFADGDESALTSLVDKEGQRLLPYIERKLPRYLRRRVGASDILQNTVVDLLKVRERFENRGVPAFRKLLNVMADLCLARMIERERAQKRDVARDEAPDRRRDPGSDESKDEGIAAIPGSGPTPSTALHQAEDRERLARILALLPAEDQLLLRLIDYDQTGYAAAAEKLGITEAAARKRHSRAIARLRHLMG